MHHLWFVENRKGQALVEYALLVALVAACLVAILGLTRNAAQGAYARTSDKVAPVAPAGYGGGSAGASWRRVSHSEGPGPTADSGSGDGGTPADSASGAGLISDH
jgi:Flp pilus assembly pilin Flp